MQFQEQLLEKRLFFEGHKFGIVWWVRYSFFGFDPTLIALQDIYIPKRWRNCTVLKTSLTPLWQLLIEAPPLSIITAVWNSSVNVWERFSLSGVWFQWCFFFCFSLISSVKLNRVDRCKFEAALSTEFFLLCEVWREMHVKCCQMREIILS